MGKKCRADIGADVTFPIPLLQGLFGFGNDHVLQCAKEYKLAKADEVFNYLTEIK
jgi:hypothetical protein